MDNPFLRSALMVGLLAGGSLWLLPRGGQNADPGTRFEDVAKAAGCQNVHTKVELSPKFKNIMPWLASVGAAVAVADVDGDGFTDVYVTNSGTGSTNRLFHNNGNG